MLAYLLKNWLPFALGIVIIVPLVNLVDGEGNRLKYSIGMSLGALFGFMLKWYFKKGNEKSKDN